MKTLINTFWMAMTLFFALNCTDVAGAPNKLKQDKTDANIRIDTLCAYEQLNFYKEGQYALQNDSQYTSFLKSTGYDDAVAYNVMIKKNVHQPDFKKYTYLAFVGPNWPRIVNVSSGEEALIVSFTEKRGCEGQPCTAPPPTVVVYFIPFIEKPVKFERIIE